MKNLPSILSIIAIIAIFLTFLVFNKKDNVDNPNHNIAGPAFTKERIYYEYMKYRDPKTGELPKHIRAQELDFINRTFKIHNKNYDPKLLSSNDWHSRGPFEIGGRTRAFDLDIRDENILIAGSVSGGMWKSIDAGMTWTKTTGYSQLHSVTCLVQDRRKGKENNWYYGTGEFWGNSAAISGDGVYKSSDNGSSWNILQASQTNKPHSWDNAFDYVWNIVIDNNAPIQKDILYVATAGNGIYRSDNGGSTWGNVLGSGTSAYFSDVAITSKGVLYATISSNNTKIKGIFRSTDGIKWVDITPSNFPASFQRVVIGIAPSDENQVYFVGETPKYGKFTTNSQGDSLYHSLFKYTYVSGDGSKDGGVWEDRSENLPKPKEVWGQMNSQTSYNLVIKVKPDDPEVLIIGAVALYRSNNGFKTPDFAWIGGTCPFDNCVYYYRYPNHHSDIHALFFSPNNTNVFYTGSDGGIHKTLDVMSDKVEWISLNNGYFTTQFYSLALSHGPQNSEKIIGGLQDNGTLLSRSNNLQQNWTFPLFNDGFYCQIPQHEQYYYASQNSTPQPKIQVYRVHQDENGVNTMKTRVDPIGGKDFIWNTPFLLDPNNDNIMYLAGGKMIWRNNDLSKIPFENSKDSTSIQWDSLNHTRIDFIEDVRPIGEVISALAISTKPANVLYYGTSLGKIYRIDNCNIGNSQPIRINKQNLPINGYVSSIAVNPDDAKKVIVSYSNYNILSIFYSEDAGENWEQISGNLEEFPSGFGAGPAVNWIEILKYENRYIYFAGTSIGLFSTEFLNGASTVWKYEGENNIGNVPIDMIDARHSDGYVAVGTHGVGVFATHYKSAPQLPSTPQLISPIANTKNVLLDTVFRWKPSQDAVFYELQLSIDSNFKQNVFDFKGIRFDTLLYNFIEQGHFNYYWRVRAVNSYGVSSYSETWNFISAVNPPKLVFPEHNQTNVDINPILSWEKVPNATAYRLIFAKGLNINNTTIDTVITDNFFELKNLEYSKLHVWQVASIEDDFQGIYSTINRFTTKKSTSVKDKPNTKNFEAKLYPNPINEKSKINLNINLYGMLQINIYDYLGRFVEKVAITEVYPGSYFYSIPINKLNNGNYFLIIEMSNQKEIIKFNKINN